MSSEVAAIEKVLQVYFDGVYEGDTKKLGEAIPPRISTARAATARLPTGRARNGSR